jgi:hypothetical protein
MAALCDSRQLALPTASDQHCNDHESGNHMHAAQRNSGHDVDRQRHGTAQREQTEHDSHDLQDKKGRRAKRARIASSNVAPTAGTALATATMKDGSGSAGPAPWSGMARPSPKTFLQRSRTSRLATAAAIAAARPARQILLVETRSARGTGIAAMICSFASADCSGLSLSGSLTKYSIDAGRYRIVNTSVNNTQRTKSCCFCD